MFVCESISLGSSVKRWNIYELQRWFQLRMKISCAVAQRRTKSTMWNDMELAQRASIRKMSLAMWNESLSRQQIRMISKNQAIFYITINFWRMAYDVWHWSDQRCNIFIQFQLIWYGSSMCGAMTKEKNVAEKRKWISLRSKWNEQVKWRQPRKHSSRSCSAEIHWEENCLMKII